MHISYSIGDEAACLCDAGDAGGDGVLCNGSGELVLLFVGYYRAHRSELLKSGYAGSGVDYC